MGTALCLLGKYSANELHPQLFLLILRQGPTRLARLALCYDLPSPNPWYPGSQAWATRSYSPPTFLSHVSSSFAALQIGETLSPEAQS